MLKGKVLASLTAILKDHNGFDVEKPLVLAVSGGVDSLVLTHALKNQGLKLIVAHVDHALRSVSAAQAEMLGRLMAEWGLPYLSHRVDVNAFAQEEKLGVEEAARMCRYRFLFEVAREHGAQGIVLGHNADDQVETVLMHFMRGSGMAGLMGMHPFTHLKQFDESIPLLRPLLNTSREEIERYARENDLNPLEDETNQQDLYYRNRLRHHIIPELEKLNPGFKQSALRAAEILRGDAQILSALEEQAYLDSLLKAGPKELVLKRPVLIALELGLQRRVIRRSLNLLRSINPDFGFMDIEKVRELIKDGKGALDISSGLQAVIVGEVVHILNQGELPDIVTYPQLPVDRSPLALNLDEPLCLNAGWYLSARLIDAKDYTMLSLDERQNPRQAFINPTNLKWPLEVGIPQAGERWAPLGLEKGSQKLSDFFVNNKIPRSARANWPVVQSGGSIVWLVGLRLAHNWRLRGDEQEILHLSLSQHL